MAAMQGFALYHLDDYAGECLLTLQASLSQAQKQSALPMYPTYLSQSSSLHACCLGQVPFKHAYRVLKKLVAHLQVQHILFSRP